MSTTIRKAVIHSFGGPENVSIVTSQIEAPSNNEVQVKVLYAGFGGSDINMRNGTYPMQAPAPLTPGYCFIGRVHVNGKNCSKFKPGDMVACMSKYDADSELVNQPEKYLIPVPDGLDLKQAVSLILDWSTAYGMVYRSTKVHKGMRVFIHGLSGAVGYALFMLCKLNGAEVYGTAGESNHAQLRELGATPFTYKNKDWIAAMNKIGGAHAVYDALGFESWDESWSILAPKSEGGGHLVGYGGNLKMLNGDAPSSSMFNTAKLLARNLVPFCPQTTSFYFVTRDQKTFEPELKELFRMLGAGEISVPIKKTMTLDEVPQTHAEWNKMGGIGSNVVIVQEDK